MKVTLNPFELGLRLGFALRACLTPNPQPAQAPKSLKVLGAGLSYLGFKGCSSRFAEH